LLEPTALGSSIPDADAVIFPQLLGEAFKRIEDIKKIEMPLMAVTSEFGTVNMWDWEIVNFLKATGIKTFAPYDLALTKTICRALAVKREMRGAKFLVYQDNPGEGFQASIFKRFYWWEDACTAALKEKFGVTIEKRSFKAFGEAAKQITDREAEDVLKAREINTEGVSRQALNSALKIYIAVKRELERDPAIQGVGINCLNESHFSDTTPCLAWNMLFEEMGMIWGCEADTMSMATKYIVHRALGAPIMMSNIYPFLMGMAALKHERIDKFPDVAEPENHLLVAHCGYLGVLPQSFSTEWQLKSKVLAIVDENATAIDARMPVGKLTLVKLNHTFDKLMVAKAHLESYVQYPDSDCRNGAVIRIKDGHRMMNSFYSHHNCLVTDHWGKELVNVAKVFDFEIEEF
jgi:L-fucose isomerase-like protein